MTLMLKGKGLTLYSEIECAGEFGSWIDDLGLNDVVKDCVNARCGDQSRSASVILSREVFRADALLEYTRFATTLQNVLSGAE
jgi:hypothetical protein